MRNKDRIGIVGGSGYIGSSLATHLQKRYEVKIVDVTKPPNQLRGRVEYTFCDVRNYNEVKKAIMDVDVVIHTAIVQIPLINEQKRMGYEVNVLGTQNVCEVVYKNPDIKGILLTGSWHTIGEKELKGVIDEAFGFRPDKVEDRARLYALSKIAQESIVRFYDEMSNNIFGIVRMGTVLGEGMPKKSAANIFIERGLKGETITPYKHSMHRQMLYVDIDDICKAFEGFASKILNGDIEKSNDSLVHIVNVYYPKPITILELAEIVQKAIMKHTNNTVTPAIQIVDITQSPTFDENDRNELKVDISKAIKFLGLGRLKSPEESIDNIVKKRIEHLEQSSTSDSPHL